MSPFLAGALNGAYVELRAPRRDYNLGPENDSRGFSFRADKFPVARAQAVAELLGPGQPVTRFPREPDDPWPCLEWRSGDTWVMELCTGRGLGHLSYLARHGAPPPPPAVPQLWRELSRAVREHK